MEEWMYRIEDNLRLQGQRVKARMNMQGGSKIVTSKIKKMAL
jgi:hypothetical protein